MPNEINLFDAEIATASEVNEVVDSAEEHAHHLASPNDILVHQQIKRIIEALLFSSNTPITFDKLRQIIDSYQQVKPRVLRMLIQELQIEYISQKRAFRLEEIAQGYLLRTNEEFSSYVEQLGSRRSDKLSHASAEVLAIIAYRQPITRTQIDAIRGVDSSGTIYNLLERDLIEPLGKQIVPGRPTLFGVTKHFLEHFGLRSLQELPPIQN